MTIEPQLHLHSHFEFDNSFNNLRCCWWCCFCCRHQEEDPKQYHVNKDLHLEKWRDSRGCHVARVIANKRLGDLLSAKFEEMPVSNEVALALLKKKIGDNFENGNPITNEKLYKIIKGIVDVKLDLEEERIKLELEEVKEPEVKLFSSKLKTNMEMGDLPSYDTSSGFSDSSEMSESNCSSVYDSPPVKEKKPADCEEYKKLRKKLDTSLPFTSGWTG